MTKNKPQTDELPIIQDWFDSLERILHEEAELAGLFSHGALIGSVREFFAARALKSVLPPSVHIGSGRVYSASAEKSKQIDIILYDASFPFMEAFPGLYLIDGVIATIEVKSTLDANELAIALDNCASVSKLSEATLGTLRRRPCTFVFGYRCKWATTKTLQKQISKWWNDNGLSLKDFPLFPNTIVAGELVAIRNGSCGLKIGAEGELAAKIAERGKDRVITAGIWKTESRFCWILMQLIFECSARVSIERGFVVNNYLPLRNYYETQMKGKAATLLSEDNPRPQIADE